MSTKITRIVGGAIIAGALLTAGPAGLALADEANPPPTHPLTGSPLNTVSTTTKTPRSNVAPPGGSANNNALIALLNQPGGRTNNALIALLNQPGGRTNNALIALLNQPGGRTNNALIALLRR